MISKAYVVADMDYVSILKSARWEILLNSALDIGIALLICFVSLWVSYCGKKRSEREEMEDGELHRPLGSRPKIPGPSTLRFLIIGIVASVLVVSFGVDVAIDIARINRDISEESYIVYEGEAAIAEYRKIGLSFEEDGETVEVLWQADPSDDDAKAQWTKILCPEEDDGSPVSVRVVYGQHSHVILDVEYADKK